MSDKLTSEQIEQAFKSARDGEPLFRAITQTLDDMYADECRSSVRPDLSPEARSYNSGRAQAIDDVRSYILSCRRLTSDSEESNPKSS
jgi:hypothetical protein